MGKLIRIVSFILIIAGILYSQTVSITGTVRDQNKRPLSGVTISLSTLGKSTTTDTDGKYAFNSASLEGGLNENEYLYAKPILDKGLIKFRVKDQKSCVQINLLKLNGMLAMTLTDENLSWGEYRISPYITNLTAQMYLVNIRIGNATYVLKLPFAGGKTYTISPLIRNACNPDNVLGKTMALSDTLKLTKSGYSYEKKIIGSYTGVHDFIMTDTAWFWGDRSKIPVAKNVMTYVFLNRTYGKFTDEQMFWKFGNMAVRSFVDAPYYDMEANSSGRVYCYAGASNSKYNDFMEHTISSTTWNGNTTRVDGFVLPCAIRLHCKDGYDEMLGEEYHMFTMSRDSLWKAYQDAVPVEFDSCARWNSDGTPFRIIAPGKGEGMFNTGEKYANYFSTYLQQIGQSGVTTNQVFSCSGTPYGNNAALAGATNRHVAHLPQSQWNDKSLFYKEAPANFYARFWHEHSFQGKAYGFAYDDAASQAAYASHGGPQYLIIAVGW